MADLPTNYLDDILAQSMNGKRKFRITRPDGTFEEVIIEDVSEYSQTGSTFGAGDINRTNQAVNEKFDSGDVVDPMLTTEEGFAADAYKTKLQFDEQNKNKVPSIGNRIVNKIVEDKEVYIANEDCYMLVLINIQSSSGVYVYVNGVALHHTFVSANETHQLSWGCYLRKGDSVQFHRDEIYPTDVSIFVYELK